MQPELSLGPTWPALGFASAKSTKSSSSESDGTSRKKRKHYTWEEPVSHPNLELHLNDPLPLDWEQCLDLQVSPFFPPSLVVLNNTLYIHLNLQEEPLVPSFIVLYGLVMVSGSRLFWAASQSSHRLAASGHLTFRICLGKQNRFYTSYIYIEIVFLTPPLSTKRNCNTIQPVVW